MIEENFIDETVVAFKQWEVCEDIKATVRLENFDMAVIECCFDQAYEFEGYKEDSEGIQPSINSFEHEEYQSKQKEDLMNMIKRIQKGCDSIPGSVSTRYLSNDKYEISLCHDKKTYIFAVSKEIDSNTSSEGQRLKFTFDTIQPLNAVYKEDSLQSSTVGVSAVDCRKTSI